MSKESTTHLDLYTEAGERLKGVKEVWTQYPRPQMVREHWQSLNGIWDLDGKPVRVPFVPQSLLAEYTGTVKEHMIYTREFSVENWEPDKRTLLHFGGVDQIAEVYVNDTLVGTHTGGYLPFTFDITSVVREKDNKLVVKVTDELNKDYPYEQSSYVGCTSTLYDKINSRMLKEWYQNSVLMDFEGKKFKAPAGYHDILTKIYGDYMQLPPEEQRVTHHSYKTFLKD